MDPVEQAVERARQLRDRGASLDRRTHELVERTDDLLGQIDEHRQRVRWWRRGRQSTAVAYPQEPSPGGDDTQA